MQSDRRFLETVHSVSLYPPVNELQKNFVVSLFSFRNVLVCFPGLLSSPRRTTRKFVCSTTDVLTLSFVFAVEAECVLTPCCTFFVRT